MVIGVSFNSETRELSDWEFEEARQQPLSPHQASVHRIRPDDGLYLVF